MVIQPGMTKLECDPEEVGCGIFLLIATSPKIIAMKVVFFCPYIALLNSIVLLINNLPFLVKRFRNSYDI